MWHLTKGRSISYLPINQQLHSLVCHVIPSSNQETDMVASQDKRRWCQGPLGRIPLSGRSWMRFWGSVFEASYPPGTLKVWCFPVSRGTVVTICWLVVERCPRSGPAGEIPSFEIECPTVCKKKMRDLRVLKPRLLFVCHRIQIANIQWVFNSWMHSRVQVMIWISCALSVCQSINCFLLTLSADQFSIDFYCPRLNYRGFYVHFGTFPSRKYFGKCAWGLVKVRSVFKIIILDIPRERTAFTHWKWRGRDSNGNLTK